MTSALYEGQCVTTAQDMKSEMQSISYMVFVDIKKCYKWSTASIQARHKCKLWDKAHTPEGFDKLWTQMYHRNCHENLRSSQSQINADMLELIRGVSP